MAELRLRMSKNLLASRSTRTLAVAALALAACGDNQGPIVAEPDADVIDAPATPIDAPDAPIDAPDAGPVSGWSHGFGGAGRDHGNDVAIDNAGNVYVVGSFSGSVDFAGETLTSAGGSDAFVIKFDANGDRVWARRFGGIGEDLAVAVAVTSSGVVVAGGFSNTVDFGGGAVTSAGVIDGFALSLTSAGELAWVVRGGGTSVDTVQDVAVDSLGNVVVLGQFLGFAEFGGPTFQSVGSSDAVVAKFTSEGAYVWSRQLGGTGLDLPAALAFLRGDDLVVAVTFGNTIDLGGDVLTAEGSRDMLVTRITGETGAHVWARRYGGINDDVANRLLATTDGFVVLGCFSESATFGGGELTSAGGSDAVVARFTADADHVWSQSWGGTADDCAFTASLTETGTVLAAGTFEGSMTIGATSVTSRGEDDAFLVELAVETGAALSVRSAGGQGVDVIESIAGVGSDFVAVGTTTASANMFEHVIAVGGMTDGFVVQTQR